MERRNFIKAGAVGTAVAATGTLVTPAIASGKRQLTMASFVPKMFPGPGEHIMDFVKMVESATGGRITIKLYGAGELVGGLESFDAAIDGTVDIANTAAYYYQGKSRALSFITSAPFGMTAMEQTAYMTSKAGKKRMWDVCDQFGLIPILSTNTGVQAGGWFRKEINSPEDLKGLKMRIPGLGGAVMSKLGVAPVTIPGGEIFQALQSGIIDATEWAGPWNDVLLGFYKVAPYYYNPGIQEPNATVHNFFNKNTWDSLSKSDQAVIEAVGESVYLRGMAEHQEKNGEFLKKLKSSKKVKFRRFNDSIYQALAEAAKELYQEMEADGDELTKATIREYFAFQRAGGGWTQISDYYYVDMRTRLFDA